VLFALVWSPRVAWLCLRGSRHGVHRAALQALRSARAQKATARAENDAETLRHWRMARRLWKREVAQALQRQPSRAAAGGGADEGYSSP
jgi:hypothetical protein